MVSSSNVSGWSGGASIEVAHEGAQIALPAETGRPGRRHGDRNPALGLGRRFPNGVVQPARHRPPFRHRLRQTRGAGIGNARSRRRCRFSQLGLSGLQNGRGASPPRKHEDRSGTQARYKGHGSRAFW
jgi:hypothetical protein